MDRIKEIDEKINLLLSEKQQILQAASEVEKSILDEAYESNKKYVGCYVKIYNKLSKVTKYGLITDIELNYGTKRVDYFLKKTFDVTESGSCSMFNVDYAILIRIVKGEKDYCNEFTYMAKEQMMDEIHTIVNNFFE